MTVCGCRKGYWHQQLDEASSFLTTFNTELGRFRYTVMPFGATVAGGVFQCKLDQCFGHIKNVIVIADDIMIVGKKHNHSDHDQTLTILLDTGRSCNVWLNYEKLQYKQDEVDFLGETYTTSSCEPAQSKVSAVTAMPAPTYKKQAQSFIGIINYLSKFSAWLWELVEPITELSKRKSTFQLGSRTPLCIWFDEKGRLPVPSTSLLQPKEADSSPNRCKHKRFRCMLAARWETNLLC